MLEPQVAQRTGQAAEAGPAQAKLMLKRIPYSETRKESERLRKLFCRWCEERGHESASAGLGEDAYVL